MLRPAQPLQQRTGLRLRLRTRRTAEGGGRLIRPVSACSAPAPRVRPVVGPVLRDPVPVRRVTRRRSVGRGRCGPGRLGSGRVGPTWRGVRAVMSVLMPEAMTGSAGSRKTNVIQHGESARVPSTNTSAASSPSSTCPPTDQGGPTGRCRPALLGAGTASGLTAGHGREASLVSPHRWASSGRCSSSMSARRDPLVGQLLTEQTAPQKDVPPALPLLAATTSRRLRRSVHVWPRLARAGRSPSGADRFTSSGRFEAGRDYSCFGRARFSCWRLVRGACPWRSALARRGCRGAWPGSRVPSAPRRLGGQVARRRRSRRPRPGCRGRKRCGA